MVPPSPVEPPEPTKVVPPVPLEVLPAPPAPLGCPDEPLPLLWVPALLPVPFEVSRDEEFAPLHAATATTIAVTYAITAQK
jgi:hypothetical protein